MLIKKHLLAKIYYHDLLWYQFTLSLRIFIVLFSKWFDLCFLELLYFLCNLTEKCLIDFSKYLGSCLKMFVQGWVIVNKTFLCTNTALSNYSAGCVYIQCVWVLSTGWQCYMWVYLSMWTLFCNVLGTIFQKNTTFWEPNAPYGDQSLVIMSGVRFRTNV